MNVSRRPAGSARDRGKMPRSDAVRNTEKLLAAARDALAEEGIAVTAHAIAARAEVGIGTFYRRLDSREELLSSILADMLDDIVATADTALTHDDAWSGLCDFAVEYVQLRSASCGVNDALQGTGDLNLSASVSAIRDRIQRLVARAHRARSLRPDVTWQDVAFLLAGVVPGGHTIGLVADETQWRRNLSVMLDGLRHRSPQVS